MNFILRLFSKLRFDTKTRFLFFGSLNFLFRQIVLGILLLVGPIFIATFVSEFLNVCIGYKIYSRYVFKSKSKFSKRYFGLFTLFSLIIWILNFSVIYLLNINFGINKNIVAILILPIWVTVSYFFQKRFIFSHKY